MKNLYIVAVMSVKDSCYGCSGAIELYSCCCKEELWFVSVCAWCRDPWGLSRDSVKHPVVTGGCGLFMCVCGAGNPWCLSPTSVKHPVVTEGCGL